MSTPTPPKPRQPIESRLGHLCCFIETRNDDGYFTGSGFLFDDVEVVENDERKPGWRPVRGSYVVTNRHVLFGLPEDEKKPNSITINVRKLDAKTAEYKWHSINLDENEIDSNVFVHDNPDVDVAVIDLANRRLEDLGSSRPVSALNAIDNHPMLTAECTDDVVIVGFPLGYYDERNHYPIVKRGIIASAWGSNFDGEPFFLIDAKLFPGSSGSIVLSKPIDHVVKDGKTYAAADGKQYALLGIYSGEPDLGTENDPEYVDVGIVWYANLIDETIKSKTVWDAGVSPTNTLGHSVDPPDGKLNPSSFVG